MEHRPPGDGRPALDVRQAVARRQADHAVTDLRHRHAGDVGVGQDLRRQTVQRIVRRRGGRAPESAAAPPAISSPRRDRAGWNRTPWFRVMCALRQGFHADR